MTVIGLQISAFAICSIENFSFIVQSALEALTLENAHLARPLSARPRRKLLLRNSDNWEAKLASC